MGETVEYVAHVEGGHGARGTVLSEADWEGLSASAKEDFIRRVVAKAEEANQAADEPKLATKREGK